MTIWTTAVLALWGAEPPKEKPKGDAVKAPATLFTERLSLTTQCEKCHSQATTKCPGRELTIQGLVSRNAGGATLSIDAAKAADDFAASWFVAANKADDRAALLFVADDGRSWRIEPAGATLRSHLQLADEVGLVVTQLGEKSLAAEAGLKKDDVLVKAAGKPLKSHKDLDDVASEGKATISCEVVRAGKPVTLELRAEAVLADPTGAHVAKRDNPPRIGVSIAAVDDALRAQIPALDGKAGVIVTAVTEKSPAAEAGLKVHDIIARLDKKEVKTDAEFRKIVQANENHKIDVEFIRAGKADAVAVVPQRPAPESGTFEVAVRAGQPVLTYLDAVHAFRNAQGHSIELQLLNPTQPTKVVVGQPLDPAGEIAALQADLAKMQSRLATLSKALADKAAEKKK